MLISIKSLEIQNFLAHKLIMVFFLFINIKMPTIVGIFNIYEQEKFHAQQS